MQMHSNTIFITGGTSGIGKALAEAFHRLGNQVIVSGRREDRLQEICTANPGMRSFGLDVRNPEAIRSVGGKVLAEFPALNCVVNNAGVQRRVEFYSDKPIDDDAMLDDVNTNLLGVIRVAAEFMPHLSKQAGATLINVSSGLAYVPLARFPVYCATKAAVHSFTLSLRHHWRASGVQVIELVPPYVATELGGPDKATVSGGPNPMPLSLFIDETLKELAHPGDEIVIGEAKNLVRAAGAETVKKIFAGMNR
jgi:uncharacterized oxidoreductase